MPKASRAQCVFGLWYTCGMESAPSFEDVKKEISEIKSRILSIKKEARYTCYRQLGGKMDTILGRISAIEHHLGLKAS